MDEHMFDHQGVQGFDYREALNGLRCRPTDWLRERQSFLVREQRRLRIEELAVTKVLDERGQVDGVQAGVSERAARETIELARALESRPAIAAAAHRGDLSAEQLAPVVKVADESSDAEWAQRAPNCAPVDLARMARSRREVTTEEAAARREARDWRMWWRPNSGMLSIRGEFPDIDGALVESVFGHMIERMRPAKGEQWDTYGHRGADAFVELCRNYADVETTYRAKPRVVVEVPADGTPEVNGIPIARSTLEGLLPNAMIETILTDQGESLAYGPGRITMPARLERAIRMRDLHCRWPGCERTLVASRSITCSRSPTADTPNPAISPASARVTTSAWKPQGPYRLSGSPAQPDGLHLEPGLGQGHAGRDDREDELVGAGAGARAGPGP